MTHRRFISGSDDAGSPPGKPSVATKKSISWFYAILPFSIASGPVGTFVQLYILQLHGTVIDVGLAITLTNAVGIPAAMIWGFVTDRARKRKPVIVASYVAVTMSLVAFVLVHSVYGTAVIYAIFSFLATASATPLNLLVMETEVKSKWATSFSKFSMVSSIGTTVGLALSFLWSYLLPLRFLVLPLGMLSMLSAILASILIREPSFAFERETMVMQKPSFSHRLLAIPLIFLKIPRLIDFRTVFRGVRYELTRQIPVLYLSIMAFYLASGIFNTSLVPSLDVAHASQSQIFLVSLAGMLVQTGSFYFAGAYVERTSLRRTAIGGLVVRASCYASIGIFSIFVTGLTYLGTTLVFYPIAGGIAFAAYYTASNTMIFKTLGYSSQASALGVYSALVGIATMAGSFVSGFISFYIGYYATFLIAAIFLMVAAALTSLIETNIER